MFEFFYSSVFWVLALYGLIEIVRNIYYLCTYNKMKNDGLYIILGVKNQEEKIEGFIRSILFRYLYGRDEYINDITIADLNSTDKTKEIVEVLKKDYSCIRVMDWDKCKKIMDEKL